MRGITKLACGALVGAFALVGPSFGLAGIGVHYGVADLTLQMDDTKLPGEKLFFEQLSYDMSSYNSNLPVLDSLPISVLREGFEAHPLNLGGKVYLDIIPFLDAVEISCNFGVWQYDGSIRYPVSVDTAYVNRNASGISNGNYSKDSLFVYDTRPLTLKEFGIGYLGLDKTPYAKLHFDLTVRKNVIKIPKRLKIIRVYAGAGASLHFATPVLSAGMVQDVIENSLDNLDGAADLIDELQGNVFENDEVMEKVVKKIIEGLTEPTVGMHIVVGTMVKPPVVPFGIYVDGKFMIPFGAMDPNVDLGGYGVLLNAGLTFGF